MMRRLSQILTLFLIITLPIFIGCEGPSGSEGAPGPEGPEGLVGPAGEDGSMMYSGQGIPDADIGENGDYYLNTDTGEMFGPKEDSGWGNPIIVLMGEDGQDGEDGSQIYSGSGVPDAPLGVEGDYYLDESSYELYGPKTSSGWGTPLNLKGADGNANVTLYIFNAPDFTSTNPEHIVTISDLSFSDMTESSWDIFFKRGRLLQFIPGKIDFGAVGNKSEFTVEIFHDNNSNDVEFRIELINGTDYYPDEIRIYRTASSSIIDNTSSMNNTVIDSPPSKVTEPKELINRVGLNNVNVIDK